jgi:hypothetical protein
MKKMKKNISENVSRKWTEDEIRDMLSIDNFYRSIDGGLMVDRHFTDRENELYNKWNKIKS